MNLFDEEWIAGMAELRRQRYTAEGYCPGSEAFAPLPRVLGQRGRCPECRRIVRVTDRYGTYFRHQPLGTRAMSYAPAELERKAP